MGGRGGARRRAGKGRGGPGRGKGPARGGGRRRGAEAGHRRGGRRGHGHGTEAHGHAHGGYDEHGNPRDLEAYLSRLEDPERAAWQKPDEVVAALGVRRGSVACDAGAGPGYFTIRLARAVGPGGRVYALEVEPRVAEVLEARLEEQGVGNVRVVLAGPGKAAVPPRPCRLILMVNTFHHFPDGPGALRALAGRLAPGGRIANVDFHERELPVGPPPEHKVSRARFLAAAEEAGLSLVEEHRFLPYQYFLVLERRRAARGRPRGRGASSRGRARSVRLHEPARGRSRPGPNATTASAAARRPTSRATVHQLTGSVPPKQPQRRSIPRRSAWERAAAKTAMSPAATSAAPRAATPAASARPATISTPTTALPSAATAAGGTSR